MKKISNTRRKSNAFPKYKTGDRIKLPEAMRLSIIERDTKNVSIHEAGHVVAALLSGNDVVWGRMYKFNDGDVFDQSTRGGCVMSSHARRTKLQSAIIGYAGVVAELLQDDKLLDLWSVEEAIEDDTFSPSPTDWANIKKIHPTWRRRALERCMDLLKANWQQVELAAELIVEDFKFEIEFNPDASEHDETMGRIFLRENLWRDESK